MAIMGPVDYVPQKQVFDIGNRWIAKFLLQFSWLISAKDTRSSVNKTKS